MLLTILTNVADNCLDVLTLDTMLIYVADNC